MRIRIDKKGFESYGSDWIPRLQAVFAWSTFESALQYSERFREPAIVSCTVEKPIWSVPSFIIEELYAGYDEKTDDSEILHVISRSEMWNGLKNIDLELWTYPKNVTQINEITDEFGDPL